MATKSKLTVRQVSQNVGGTLGEVIPLGSTFEDVLDVARDDETTPTGFTLAQFLDNYLAFMSETPFVFYGDDEPENSHIKFWADTNVNLNHKYESIVTKIADIENIEDVRVEIQESVFLYVMNKKEWDKVSVNYQIDAQTSVGNLEPGAPADQHDIYGLAVTNLNTSTKGFIIRPQSDTVYPILTNDFLQGLSLQQLQEIVISGVHIRNLNFNNIYSGAGTSRLKKISFNNLRDNKITSMVDTFINCPELEECDLSALDISAVSTSAANMFSGCYNLKTLKTGEGWQYTLLTSTSGHPRFPVFMVEKNEDKDYDVDSAIPAGKHTYEEADRVVAWYNTDKTVLTFGSYYTLPSNISTITGVNTDSQYSIYRATKPMAWEIPDGWGSDISTVEQIVFNTTVKIINNDQQPWFKNLGSSNIDSEDSVEIDLSKLDFSEAKNLQNFFNGANIETFNSGLAVGLENNNNIVNFSGMFNGCNKLTTLTANFSISNATTLSGFINNCNALETLVTGMNWNYMENATKPNFPVTMKADGNPQPYTTSDFIPDAKEGYTYFDKAE